MKLLDIYAKNLSAEDREKLLENCEKILTRYILKDKASRN